MDSDYTSALCNIIRSLRGSKLNYELSTVLYLLNISEELQDHITASNYRQFMWVPQAAGDNNQKCLPL